MYTNLSVMVPPLTKGLPPLSHRFLLSSLSGECTCMREGYVPEHVRQQLHMSL